MFLLIYIFEYSRLTHKPNTLWLEFGVASGRTINYISNFTNDIVLKVYQENGEIVLIKEHLI